MNYDAKRAFEFLNKIGFVRTAGSDEELRAAQMIHRIRYEELNRLINESNQRRNKTC